MVVGGTLPPVGGSAVQSKILEHARSHTVKSGIELGFDLAQGGFGMLEAPLVDASDDVGTQLVPGLFEAGAVHRASLCWLQVIVCAEYLMLARSICLCKKMTHTQSDPAAAGSILR